MEEWNMALDKHGDGQTSPSPPTLLKLKLKTFGWAWCRCLTHLAEWMEKWKWTYETLEIWRILKFQSHSLQKTKVLFIVRSVGSQLLSIAMTASSQGGEISIFYLLEKMVAKKQASHIPFCKIQMASRSLLLMVQKSGVRQLRLAAYPIIYRVWDTSKRWLAWFLNHQP